MNLNKVNNVIMFLFFLAVAFSGLTMELGTRGGGLHYYWKKVHVFCALILIILVVLHWILHFNWFKSLFKKQ